MKGWCKLKIEVEGFMLSFVSWLLYFHVYLALHVSYLRHDELAKKLHERMNSNALLRKAKALNSQMTESDPVDKVKLIGPATSSE